MDSDPYTENDLKKRNDIKSHFYEVFKRKIELGIIDMVLSNCDYDADKALDHLLTIGGQNDFSSQNGVGVHKPLNLLDQFSGKDSSKTFNNSSGFLQSLTVNEKLDNEKLSDVFLEKNLNNPTYKVLVIMRGLPGSGKSTKARQLRGANGLLYSTDDFFFDNERYIYDPYRLQEAHQWNQRRTNDGMELNISPIIIDNTNTMAWEIKPYVAMALKHNYMVYIIEPVTPWAWNPSELAKRNTHGVSKDHIEHMKEKYEKHVTVESIIKSFNLKVPSSYLKRNSNIAPDGASSKETDSNSDKEMCSAQPDLSVKNPEISENVILSDNFIVDVSSFYDSSTKSMSIKKKGKIEDIVSALVSTVCGNVPKSDYNSQSKKQTSNQCVFNSYQTEENVIHSKSNLDNSSSECQLIMQNELLDFDIKFLTECFPLQDENYIRNYLLQYDGDLLKTVDHLSNLTYMSDKPDSEDMEQDDIKDTSYSLNNTTQNCIDQNSIAGEIIYCDTTNGEDVNIIIDPRLGMELIKRFGSGDDYENLYSADYVMELNPNLAKELHSSWLNSVKKRKRAGQTVLESGNSITQHMQESEKAKTEFVDGNVKKKQRIVPIGNKYSTKDTPKAAFGEKLRDFSGKHLTSKQQRIREDLYSEFPGVDKNALDDVLESCGYCLKTAISLTNSSCGLKPGVKNVYASSAIGWKTIESPPNKKTIEPNKGVKYNKTASDVYQTLSENDQNYNDLRAEAYQYATLRAECFQKAAKAFQEKKGPVAQHYADEGHRFTVKMKEAHARAAKIILCRKNANTSPEIIDLHGLHANEGIDALKRFIADSKNGMKIT